MFKNFSLLLVLILSVCLVLFSYIIPAFYLRYINKMNEEDCKCSKDFSRNFVHFYAIYIYVSVALIIVTSLVISRNDIKKVMKEPTNLVMSIGFSFLVAYYMYQYNQKINTENCECANSWEVEVMKYHSYLIFFMVFIASLNVVNVLLGNKDIRNSLTNNLNKLNKK